MGELPTDVRDAVITTCYARAAELNWESLGYRERSRVYDDWLDDPDIGQALTAFLSRERARVWLKDGPMKEYARALTGIGPFARFAAVQLPGPGQLARRVLGDDWQLVEGTMRAKPNRVLLTNKTETLQMLWGPPRNMRDLLWAAMTSMIDDHLRPLIVLITTRGETLSDTEKHRYDELGGLAGIKVRHTTVTLKRRAINGS